MRKTSSDGAQSAGTSDKADDQSSITFDAAVAQVRTLADGGIRIQFDLSESSIDAAAWLMKARQGEMYLHVACVVNREPAKESVKKEVERKGAVVKQASSVR